MEWRYEKTEELRRQFPVSKLERKGGAGKRRHSRSQREHPGSKAEGGDVRGNREDKRGFI